MKIVLSNDDGYQAEGIIALADALAIDHELQVVAPDRNRSGASNSLTLTRPLRAERSGNGFWAVDGTPTDSVHLAMTGLLEGDPDMVISGINHGANLGDDVLYSGTVAAAMEGRFLGYPAIAVSLASVTSHHEVSHFQSAVYYTLQILQQIDSHPLPPQTILNINVPDLPLEQIEGVVATRLGSRHRAEPMVRSYDPRGKAIYWVGPSGGEADCGEGTDFAAIRQHKVSVSPVVVDLTRHDSLAGIARWIGLMQEQKS
ncbi:5'/3'-nucleotidase SurE [Ectothiorhodospiraceae bacterium BW-2]|nr:5'/3'-nucleotidase SurE [Ectothiorhodospiraceae bacterium BW-2]